MKHLLLLLALLLPAIASAHDFEVDGIYYNINGNEATVTYRGDSYYNANSYYGDVVIPSSVTFNGITYTVTAIGKDAFCYCKSLTSITIPNSVTSIGSDAFCCCTGITNIEIPNSVISISDYAFDGCTGITSVEILDSVISIGSEVFANCSSLRSINVASGNQYYDSRDNCNAIIETSSNTLIEGCINSFIPISVSTIGVAAFRGRTGLTHITIPDQVTSIEAHAFQDCTGLTSINLPNTITTISFCSFFGCTGLTSVIIPNSVTTIEEAAFYDSGITNVLLGNNLKSIGNYAFMGCNLSTLTIPNSVTSLGVNVFEYGIIKSIIIPNSINTTIIFDGYYDEDWNGSNVFIVGEGEWKANSIDDIYIYFSTLFFDSAITSINNEDSSFGNDYFSTHVYSFSTVPPSINNNIEFYIDTLHVPAASVAAYFTASGWGNSQVIIGDAVEPTGMTISKDSIAIVIDENYSLIAAVVPQNATIPHFPISWFSSNPEVAIVNNGIVHALSEGECTIIATCINMQISCHVTVASDRITLDKDEIRVLPNHIIDIGPTSFSYDYSYLSVSSSDPTVAAARVINGKVQVVGIKEGTAIITVSATDGTAIPATCLVTVYTEPGDANCDGFVNISDVTDLIDYLLGSNVANFKTANADLDNDGKISIGDVTALIDVLLSSN